MEPQDPEAGTSSHIAESEPADAVTEMTVPPPSNDYSNSKRGSLQARKLSRVSTMYDVDGNGLLDEAELAMRMMDTSNRGYLTNDKVYKLMEQHIDTQKQLFRVKRIMFVLLALVVILALSNLGTSFAASSLAKDTTTSSNAEYVDKGTKEQLSTQSNTALFLIERSVIDSDGTRRLCSRDQGDLACDTADDTGGSTGALTMDKDSCRKMFRQCKRGNSVTLVRPFPEAGQESTINLCPFKRGRISRSDRSTLRTADGESVKIEREAGGHCTISGPAVQSREGEACQGRFDCGSGMNCRRSEALIHECRRRCARKRWAHSRVRVCQSDCDYRTCEAEEAEEEKEEEDMKESEKKKKEEKNKGWV